MAEDPTEPDEFQQSYTDENGNFHYYARSSHTFTNNAQDFQSFADAFDGPLSSMLSRFSVRVDGTPLSSTSQANYWARWQYTQEEWQRFDRFDFARATLHMLIFAGLSLLAYLLAVAFFLSLFMSATAATDDTDTFSTIFFPLMLLLLFLPLLFHIVRHYVPRVRRHRARVRQDARRVTIGAISFINDQAIWESGQYIPLQSLLFTLKRVQFKDQPVPRLHFRRRHLEIRQSSWSDTIEIPVPAGHEDEARALVQRFYQETIKGQRIQTPAEPQ